MAPVLGIADPVEILLNTVRDGKMDPWKIDIIQVTDGFLQELDRIGQDDPQLLARSARCIFYASALVHLKAQALNDASLLMDEDDFVDDEDFMDYERPARLERPLFYPRADAPLVPRDRRPRGRSLTLTDLLDALKRLESETLSAVDEDYEDPWDVPIFDEDIPDIPTAHEDDLEGDILNLREVIRGRFDADDKSFTLDELRGDMTRGIAFRALLFLAHDGEVELEQEEFYQEVTIVPGAEPLKEVTEEEKLKRQSHEDRRSQAREERKKRRSIPRPNNRRGRKLTRRPGLSPAASSRRPKSRLRGSRILDRKAPEFDEHVLKKKDEQT